MQAADLSDASMENPVRLKKLGYISAGDSGEERIVSGQCIQIATGAPLPRGADTTVMKEDIELEDSNVLFFQAIPKSENIRFYGEDIVEGQTVIPLGTVIGPAQLAVLATFGSVSYTHLTLPTILLV